MEKLVIIDSCMRPESRTRRILDAAKEALSSRYDIESIDVNEAALPPLTPKSLAERSSGIVLKATVALARKDCDSRPFLGYELPCRPESLFREYIPLRSDLHGQRPDLHGTVPMQESDVHNHKRNEYPDGQHQRARQHLSAGLVFALGSGRDHHRGRLESGLPLTRRSGGETGRCLIPRQGHCGFVLILTGNHS